MRPYAIALAVVLPVVLEADPHRYVLHRVPENLAIASLAFSPQDQLYLASPAGVYRYDGVRFHRLPIDLPGLRHIAFTSDGVLWVASDAGLHAFHEGRWQLAQWDGVQQLLPAGDRLYGVATGIFEFRMTGGQALRKRLDLLPGQALRPGSRGAAGLDSQSRLWHLNVEGTAIFRDQELMRRLDRVWDGVVPGADGRYWLTSGQRATLWEGAQMVRSLSRRPVAVLRESGPVLSGRSSAWFLGDEEIVGDSRTFRAPPAHVAHPITAAAEDRHGHLWVARHGLGLVEWIPDAEWERWPATYFEGEPVTLVARSRKGEMVAATHSHLRRLEPGRWRVFDREANHYHGLLALENGEWLATTANHGVVRIDAGGGAIPLPLPPVNRFLRANSREIMRDSQGQVWIANKENLLSVRDGRVEVESLPDSGQESDYPNDLEVAAD